MLLASPGNALLMVFWKLVIIFSSSQTAVWLCMWLGYYWSTKSCDYDQQRIKHIVWTCCSPSFQQLNLCWCLAFKIWVIFVFKLSSLLHDVLVWLNNKISHINKQGGNLRHCTSKSSSEKLYLYNWRENWRIILYYLELAQINANYMTLHFLLNQKDPSKF